MLKDDMFSPKKWRWSFWPSTRWARGFLLVLLTLLFLSSFFYALEKGTSRQLVRVMAQQSFPFEAIILEGIPGYSQPEREYLNQVRTQGVSLGTFLLTGVNVADARTYFFSYFTPPPGGPAWIGWAYNPGDPEYEGEIPELEEIQLNPSKGQAETQPVLPLDDKVLIGIYHTHNSESYAGDGGEERDDGGNGEIVSVGKTLKESLGKHGIRAVQALELHDVEDFNKAYSKSVYTAAALVRNYPSIKLLLDLHRDGLPPGVNKSTVMIQGKEVGRVMIVIGQKNPHWEKNDALAKEIIAFAEEKYPGLFIPRITYASDARYNQHLLDGAILFEIGSQLNTYEEAEGTAEILGSLLADWLKE
ncbi:stage II sporulation protein P [Desulfitobacterium dehalogenans ATCC 51507]|uniref:Stage II sporulation protein P n=1 Tax=Desulfitobacterium dehalogenans (strain ATCC 51507 / DSM 9161 / JW/IU-DC1) TaxID=756499 RepID=I4ADB5_DESDJ|nr:stage II sporulation protein P [Desulfitobacterium dehalogenans]AFM01950.1 stage II sporulation protein P [Desulfitobacterium dehalogenans ATCC 51507]